MFSNEMTSYLTHNLPYDIILKLSMKYDRKDGILMSVLTVSEVCAN